MKHQAIQAQDFFTRRNQGLTSKTYTVTLMQFAALALMLTSSLTTAQEQPTPDEVPTCIDPIDLAKCANTDHDLWNDEVPEHSDLDPEAEERAAATAPNDQDS